MKKLMFAAVAAFCGTVMALESANVVGYQDKAAAKSGWNLICGTFEKVDGSELTLADVKPNAAFTWMNSDTIQFLDDGGGTRVRTSDGQPAIYGYFTTSDGAPADGWYHYDSATLMGMWVEPEAADDFSYGAGVVVQTFDKTGGLMFSGAVHAGAATIVADKSGWNLIGNPTPCDLTLKDVTPNATFTWMNSDTIQFLDDGGGTRVRTSDGQPAIYGYFTTLDGAPADGWYHYDSATLTGMWVEPEEEDNTLNAGDAFVVQTFDKTAGLQFKAALP
jgi:hypothetical protein